MTRHPPNNTSPWTQPAFWLGMAAIGCATLLAWLSTSTSGDTFVWLASGRDTFAGRLGLPDTWSFVTEGRVWLDQNWGTGVLLFSAHEWFGPTGIVGLKAMTAMLAVGGLVAWIKARGASLTVALLVTAVAFVTLSHYIDLRANMFTIALVPLFGFVLVLARSSGRYLWVAAGLIAAWANLHGGFMFGIGMLGLWPCCLIAARLLRRKPLGFNKNVWKWVATSLVAILLAVLLNPFGLDGFLLPFALLDESGSVWHQVAEWRSPLANPLTPVGKTEHLFLWSGALAGLAIAGIYFQLSASGSTPAERSTDGNVADDAGTDVPRPEKLPEDLFDMALALVGFAMAFSSVRFIPIAVLCAAPLFGRALTLSLAHHRSAWPTVAMLVICAAAIPEVQRLAARALATTDTWDVRFAWAASAGVLALAPLILTLVVRWLGSANATEPKTGGSRQHWPTTAAGACVLLMYVTQLLPAALRHYDANNPRGSDGTLFDKMVNTGTFPVAATQFLNDNAITARVFNDWGWEGYLRWTSPAQKVFVGGRAQLIYTADEYRRYQSLIGPDSSPFEIRAAGANLILMSAHRNQLVQTILRSRQSGWKPLYYDGATWLFANVTDPDMAQVYERSQRGELRFADPSVKATSQAMAIAFDQRSNRDSGILRESAEALLRANLQRSFPASYVVYGQLAQQLGQSARALETVFQRELKRLEQTDYQRAGGGQIVQARTVLTQVLERLALARGNSSEASRWRNHRHALIRAWTLGSLDNSWPELPGAFD